MGTLLGAVNFSELPCRLGAVVSPLLVEEAGGEPCWDR
jgi:hypothetical protein